MESEIIPIPTMMEIAYLMKMKHHVTRILSMPIAYHRIGIMTVFVML